VASYSNEILNSVDLPILQCQNFVYSRASLRILFVRLHTGRKQVSLQALSFSCHVEHSPNLLIPTLPWSS